MSASSASGRTPTSRPASRLLARASRPHPRPRTRTRSCSLGRSSTATTPSRTAPRLRRRSSAPPSAHLATPRASPRRATPSPSSRDAWRSPPTTTPPASPRWFSNPSARVLLRRDRWDGTRFDLDDVFPSGRRRASSTNESPRTPRAALAGDLAAVIACGRLARERPASSASPPTTTGPGRVGSGSSASPTRTRTSTPPTTRTPPPIEASRRARSNSDGRRGGVERSVTVRLSYVLARGEARTICSGPRRVDAARVARGSDRGKGGRARALGATSTEVATLAEAVASIRVGEANRRRANRFAGGVVRGSHAHAVLYADVRVDGDDGTTTLGTLALVDVGDFFAPNADDLAEIRRRATGDDGYSLDGVDGVPRGALARLLGDFLAPDKVVGWIFAVDPRRSRVEETAATLAFARDVRESAARRLRPRVGRRRIGFGSGSDRGVDVDVSARTSPENVSRRDVSARTSPENVSYRAVAREVHRVSRELDAELARRASAERRAEEATREGGDAAQGAGRGARAIRRGVDGARGGGGDVSRARRGDARRGEARARRGGATTDGERRRAAATRGAWERDEDRREERRIGGARRRRRRRRNATNWRRRRRRNARDGKPETPRRRRHSRRHRRRGRWNAPRSSRRRRRRRRIRAGERNAPEPRRRSRRRRRSASSSSNANACWPRRRRSVDVSPRRRSRRGDSRARTRSRRRRDSGRSWRRVFGVSPTPKRTPSTTTGIAGAARPSRPRLPELFRKRDGNTSGCVSRANERAAAAEANAERFRAEAEDVARGAAAAAADVEARVRERVEAEAAAKFAAIADEFDADVEALETRLVRAETAAIRGERAAERATSALEAWWIREASRRAAAAEEREASRRDAAERRAAWARREARLHETFHDELRRRLDDGGAKWTGGTPWKWAHGDLDEEDATTEATLEARAATEARRRDATTTVFARVDRLEGVVELAAHDRAEIRRRAVRIVAAVAADPRGDAARRVVEAGAAKALLRVIGGGFGDGSDDESARRDAVGALANLAAAETNHAAMLDAGALEMVALFARNARDAASLRAAAAAAANLCGGGEVDVAGTPRANGSARPAGGTPPPPPRSTGRRRGGRGGSSARRARRGEAGGTRGRAEVARRRGRDASRAAAAARAEPATARRAAKALCLMASSEEGAAEVRDDPDARRVVERVAKEAGRGSAARRKAEGAMAERITESAEELATDSCDRATNQTIHT